MDLVCYLDGENGLVLIENAPPGLEALALRLKQAEQQRTTAVAAGEPPLKRQDYLKIMTPLVRPLFNELFEQVRTQGSPRSFASRCDGDSVQRTVMHTILPCEVYDPRGLAIRVQTVDETEKELEFEKIARSFAQSSKPTAVRVCTFCSTIMGTTKASESSLATPQEPTSAGGPVTSTPDFRRRISHDACEACVSVLKGIAASKADESPKREHLMQLLPIMPIRAWKILVVDDSKFFVSLLRTMFRKISEGSELEVCCAKDGQDAMSRCLDATFDIVISDMVMPVMDGGEFFRRFRALENDRGQPKAIIIAISGDSTQRTSAVSAGADDFILKPITVQYLGVLVNRLIKEQSDKTGNSKR